MTHSLNSKPRGLFITATDTGSGKTAIGSLLTKALYDSGLPVKPRKPIESGCHLKGEELIPADGLCYFNAIEKSTSLGIITPYRLQHPVSPARAAKLEAKCITLNEIYLSCLHSTLPEDILIIEGAGGLYSPLTNNSNNADLAKMLNLPVLLIAENKLGCINHILLTLEALKSQKLDTAAIVLNRIKPIEKSNLENNLETLQQLTTVPIIDFPHLTSESNNCNVFPAIQNLTRLIKI